MTFSIDKTKVTEGDIVEVKWDCSGAQTASLTLDNGYTNTTMAVEPAGTKKFRLNRVGNTTITLTISNGKKESTKKHKIKVSAKKYDTYQRVGDNKIKEWWDKMRLSTKNYFSRVKYGWGIMPKDKKQATISLTIILGIMIISSFFPSAVFFGLSLLAVYCFYILMKK